MIRGCFLSFLCLLIPHITNGQQLTPGQRIRVTLGNSVTHSGIFDSVGQDGVWFRTTRQRSAAIPRDRIHVIEQSQDRKPALAKGLGYGALAGALVGGALWLAFINGDPYEEMKGEWAAVFLASGAVGGALAGAGVSVILASDRWVVVPRDQWATGISSWQLGLRLTP
jgi:membrane associated rhomboid family serine protease